MFIGNLCRPPDGNHTNALSELESILIEIHGQGNADIVIFGDMNIDYKASADNKCRDYKNLLYSYHLKQHITDHTRVTDTSKTTIDHIVTNREALYNTFGVLICLV